MTIAHVGLGVFVIGAVVETSQRYETTLDLALGDSANVAGWVVTLEDIGTTEGPNWFADRATLSARKGGQTVRLQPEKRYYPAARMPTSETAIHKSASGDLYFALGDRRVLDGEIRWTFRAYFNPSIDLVFGGVVLIALGGLLSVLPRRWAFARKSASSSEQLPTVEAAE